MATRRNKPPPAYQTEPRWRPYQAMPIGMARKTRVNTNSATSNSTETAPLRATAMPIWVKNATTARKRVIHQRVLGRVRRKAIIRAFLMPVVRHINANSDFLKIVHHAPSSCKITVDQDVAEGCGTASG